MCGIAGYIEWKPGTDPMLLSGMTQAILHRGPDDSGTTILNNVALGFRRLSIIDLKGGHQPMLSQSGNCCIVFNGEIYNYRELRLILEREGEVFRTQSDTEVLLTLYERRGMECLKLLRGMFSFVIYDQGQGILFGARDHFGIKPLYYSRSEGRFLFASEMKSILCDHSVSRELDPMALDEYITYGYVLGERSIYKGIKKLRPGCYFTIKTDDPDSFRINSFWSPTMEPDYSRTEESWQESIRSGLKESVQLMMNADVPYGAFLSGGIDSSSVVAVMASISPRPVKTFSIGFKEKDFNELDYARAVARKYNTEHYEQIVQPGSVEMISQLVQIYDEPFADSSAIPTYLVSKFAREHVTMVLSGDGGDEIFGGYNRYLKMLRLHRRPLNNRVLNKVIFGSLARILPDHFPGKGLAYYLSLNSEYIGAYMGIFKPHERRMLYNPEFQQLLGNHFAEDKMILDFTRLKGDFISRIQQMEMTNYMTDDVLTKVDRASMAASLEVRVPLLDHKLFEVVSGIPSGVRIKGGELKAIFKSAMKDFLPEEVLNHRKQGFGVPLKHWFKAELKDYIIDSLQGNKTLIYQYFKREEVNTIIKGHERGYRDFSFKLWSLLYLQEWLKSIGS